MASINSICPVLEWNGILATTRRDKTRIRSAITLTGLLYSVRVYRLPKFMKIFISSMTRATENPITPDINLHGILDPIALAPRIAAMVRIRSAIP